MQLQNYGRGGLAMAGGMLAVLVLARPGFAVDIIDDPVQIDERAAQLVQTSNSLCWEMYRYHQQKPDYPTMYRTAKDLWSQAGDLRNALRAGPMESQSLAQRVAQMNDSFARIEQGVSKWGDGDRSQVPLNGAPRSVVVDNGVSVNLPLLGVQVGGPRYVVTDELPAGLERMRLHPNSRGSKRSLEREVAALRVAIEYLQEDSGVTVAPAPPQPGDPEVKGPVPNPPPEGPTSDDSVKIVPKSAKKPAPAIPK